MARWFMNFYKWRSTAVGSTSSSFMSAQCRHPDLSYSDIQKANPQQRFPNEEDMTYIRIYKHDYLYIRVEKEPQLMAELRLKNEGKSAA